MVSSLKNQSKRLKKRLTKILFMSCLENQRLHENDIGKAAGWKVMESNQTCLSSPPAAGHQPRDSVTQTRLS